MTVRSSLRPHLILLVLLALFTAACGSGFEYGADWDTELEYTRYHTFSIEDDLDDVPAGLTRVAIPDHHLLSVIKSAVQRELEAKHFETAHESSADLIIHLNGGHRDETQEIPSNEGSGRSDRPGHIDHRTGTDLSHYRTGTLIIDIIDRTSRRLVFHGFAEGIISGRTLTDEDIGGIVADILEQFPPE
ncbi:MAG: DUF4136 domain-containing protein [Deltaproteobacteria bacterium]|nr:DUF4136 domain-containing protein [Deltaproteobacteria bacterium]